MAMNSVGAIINHSANIMGMIRDEIEQEQKHLKNARCKPANWNGIACYIESATGISCTGEEVRMEVMKRR